MTDETSANGDSELPYGSAGTYGDAFFWGRFRVDEQGDLWIDSNTGSPVDTDARRYLFRSEVEELIELVRAARSNGPDFEAELTTSEYAHEPFVDVRVERDDTSTTERVKIWFDPTVKIDVDGPSFLSSTMGREVDTLIEMVRYAWDEIGYESSVFEFDDGMSSSLHEPTEIGVGDTVKVVDDGFGRIPTEGTVRVEREDSYDVVFDTDPFVEAGTYAESRVITCAERQCFVPGDEDGLVSAVRYVESTRQALGRSEATADASEDVASELGEH